MPVVKKEEVALLTGSKNTFSFGQGSGKTIANQQKDALLALPVIVVITNWSSIKGYRFHR